MSKYSYELPDHPLKYGQSIELASLHVEPLAQRSYSKRRAQMIASNIVPSAVGQLVVSERTDGTRWLVDGQHRRGALLITGYTEWPCEVHYGLTLDQEAVLFLIKNRESQKPNALDQYKIGLTAGLPLYVDTQRELDARDLTLGGASPNSIAAVQAVLGIVERADHTVLGRTLDVAQAAWGRARDTWDGMLIAGLGLFLARHGDVVDDEHLAKKLGKRATASMWRGMVMARASANNTRHSGTQNRKHAAYELILDEWNYRKTRKVEPVKGAAV